MASATDKLLEVGDPGTATTLSAPGYTTGGTSITVGSTSNWPTATGVVFAIDEVEVVNGVEQQVAGTYNEYVGTVATGTSVTNVSWQRGSGDRNYSAGSSTRVYIPVSSERENRIVEWGLVDHNQDGSHKFTQVLDANGNELVKFTSTPSAVNELTVANAATGSTVKLSATGGDTNIGLEAVAKGTGINRGFLAVKAGTFTVTGNGSKAITGLGFTPKYLEVRLLDNNDNSGAVLCMSYGATDGTTTWGVGFRAQETNDISGITSTSLIAWRPGSNQAKVNTLAYSSFDSDGFTLTVASYASDGTFSYTAFG